MSVRFIHLPECHDHVGWIARKHFEGADYATMIFGWQQPRLDKDKGDRKKA